MFQEHCSVDTFSSVEKVVGYLKNIYEVAKKGETLELDVVTVLKSLLVCKPLIDQCIAPKLQVMKDQCTANNYYYAPNLTAMSSWYNRDAPGLFYDDTRHTLTIQVLNNGSAYAWDIYLNVLYGTTDDRKKPVSGGGFLLENEKIKELVHFGAQQTGSQTFMGSVKDFLIDQSNFSSYLSSQKTDHKLRPFYWEKTIPFTAKPNELTKITMVIDPNQDISEQSEKDNVFSLIIDNLPTPHRFKIENLKVERVEDSLVKYKTSFDIRNTGEEDGNAIVKYFEKNNQQQIVGTLTEGARDIAGKGVIHVERVFDIDVSASGNNCLKHKDYRVEVWDEEGVHDQGGFEIPAFAGEIYGRVVDLFGKAVAGVTVKTDTGATTQTQTGGYFHLKGINRLGKVTVTASSDKYSQTESQEVDLQFLTDDFLHTCTVKGLTVMGINFVMKNKPVDWTIILKDAAGKPVKGTVICTSDLFRHATEVDGSKVLSPVQPDTYLCTANAGGYYSQFKTVTLAPPTAETVFIFEQLGGRTNDDGLRIITPTLLWKKRLGPGGGKIGELAATKNGKLLVVAVGNNKTRTSKLYFIDPLTGRIVKEADTPYTIAEQRNIGLDASYDGRTVGLYVNTGAPGMTDKKRILNLYNASGEGKGSTTMNNSIFLDVSPDGFYLYPGNLVNAALHKYTRKEMEGVGDGHDLQGYGSFVYFLRSNNLISGCKFYQDNARGWCERDLADKMIRSVTELAGVPRIIDESNLGTLILRTDEKLYYLGSASWEKDIKRDNSFVSASLSPGGMYAMTAEGSGSNTSRVLKIFGSTGGDKTPTYGYKDVRFVSANDKGLFFASVVSDSISYYQVGAYAKDYNAAATATGIKGSNFITDFFAGMQSFFSKIGSLFSGKKP